MPTLLIMTDYILLLMVKYRKDVFMKGIANMLYSGLHCSSAISSFLSALHVILCSWLFVSAVNL